MKIGPARAGRLKIMIEFETKILNVNKETIKFLNTKAILINKRHLVKRFVYGLGHKNSNNSWIRILDDNGLSLCYKNYKSYKIGGIDEIELKTTGKLEDLKKLLTVLGCKLIAEQHSYESNYEYNGAKIDLEKWPMIPPYLEIEGKNKKSVLDVIKLMGFDKKDSRPITTKMVYKLYNIDLHKFKRLI
jgi:adenylate cyclase class 2